MMEPVSKRPTLANLCVGLKFQSSIPMESGLTDEISARLFNPVSLRGTLTKLKRFEIGSDG